MVVNLVEFGFAPHKGIVCEGKGGGCGNGRFNADRQRFGFFRRFHAKCVGQLLAAAAIFGQRGLGITAARQQQHQGAAGRFAEWFQRNQPPGIGHAHTVLSLLQGVVGEMVQRIDD